MTEESGSKKLSKSQILNISWRWAVAIALIILGFVYSDLQIAFFVAGGLLVFLNTYVLVVGVLKVFGKPEPKPLPKSYIESVRFLVNIIILTAGGSLALLAQLEHSRHSPYAGGFLIACVVAGIVYFMALTGGTKRDAESEEDLSKANKKQTSGLRSTYNWILIDPHNFHLMETAFFFQLLFLILGITFVAYPLLVN